MFNFKQGNRIVIAYLAIAIVCCVVPALSCNKSTHPSNQVYIDQAVNKTAIPLTIDNGSGKVDLFVASAYVAAQDIPVNVSFLDSNYVNEFNEQHATEYVIAPRDAVNLSSSVITIQKGRALGDKPVTVFVKDWTGFVEGRQYVMPVKIVPQGNISALSGSDVILVSISKVINTAAAQNGSYPLNESIMGQGTLTKPVTEATIEGRFMYTNRFRVSASASGHGWRSNIFSGFGIQVLGLGNTDGKIDIRFGGGPFLDPANNSLQLNTWYHFAVTIQNDLVKLYLDGDLIGQTSLGHNLNIGYCIGDGVISCGFSGYASGTGLTLSECRIWNVARTRKQIQANRCAVDPATQGLMGYWRFNEGAGNIIKDVSGNQHDITSQQSVTWIDGVKCP